METHIGIQQKREGRAGSADDTPRGCTRTRTVAKKQSKDNTTIRFQRLSRSWTIVSDFGHQCPLEILFFLHFGPQFTIGHVKRQCPALIGHVSNFRHQCPILDNNVLIQILVSDFRHEVSDFGHQCPISVTRAQFLSQVSDFGQ